MRAAAFVLALAGCASHTGVVPLGAGGEYMIAKQHGVALGLGNLKAEIIQEASVFCRSSNRELRVVSASETKPPYIFGNYPRAEVQFACDR